MMRILPSNIYLDYADSGYYHRTLQIRGKETIPFGKVRTTYL